MGKAGAAGRGGQVEPDPGRQRGETFERRAELHDRPRRVLVDDRLGPGAWRVAMQVQDVVLVVARQQVPRRRGRTLADQVETLARMRTAVDDVAEHHHQVGTPAIDVGEDRLQRRQVGVDVRNESELHPGRGRLVGVTRRQRRRHQIRPACLISLASRRWYASASSVRSAALAP